MKQEWLWLWMQQLFGMGTHRAHEALARYGTPQGLLGLSPQAVEADAFLTPKDKRAVRAPDFGEARRVLEDAEAFGAVCITPESACYPACLHEIHAPPYLLYAVGDLSLLGDRYRVTMVGARKPDEYGLTAA
ncbi:MAG: DNA-processing protein DprA, partial [Oscillospiraceae bacterium]